MERERAVDGAAVIAATSHVGQRDKQGVPYILHVARVAAAVADDLEACAVAWLHDVAEDHGLVVETLRGTDGWTDAMVDALALLTKPHGENHGEYVRRIAETRGRAGAIAQRVKLADVHDNLGRLPVEEGVNPEWVQRLVGKYVTALRILEGRE